MSQIVSILLTICCLLLQSMGIFDPDVDICIEPKLNGAVIDDENHSYIFKGMYYWKTRSLDKEQGIDGYARRVDEKWSEVTNDTKTIFTVKTNGSLITVFVGNNLWFGYQKGVKKVEGNTSIWPEFDNLKITAAFSETLNGSNVFILHSNNSNYSLYDFNSLETPKVVRKGWALVKNGIMTFLDPQSSNRPGTTLGSLLDVRAGLTYEKNLILIAEKFYCSVNLMAVLLDQKCNVSRAKQLLGCPLDLSNRTTTTQTVITTDPNEPTVATVTIDVTNSTQTNGTDDTDDTDVAVEQDSTEYSTNCLDCFDSTEDTEKALIRKNSDFWFIVFLVTFIVIVICLMISIIIVSNFNRKKPKGEKYFIK